MNLASLLELAELNQALHDRAKAMGLEAVAARCRATGFSIASAIATANRKADRAEVSP